VAGGAAIVAVFFFGTLFVSDYFFPDYVRARDIKSVKVALEKYRAVKGHYPGPAGGVPLNDLRSDLVGGGFISDIPHDPENGPDWQYMYASDGAAIYIIMVHLKYAVEKVPAGGACITGVGLPASARNSPDCPF
jgi:hypothetical protein